MAGEARGLPYIVGLTGGIGCGKTTVSDLFAKHGVAVVDTDLIAHALTGPHGKAMPSIVAAFGEDVCAANGALDRGVMRQRVFSDPVQRKRLEAILHPMIFTEALAACSTADRQSPYVLLVVPLMVEVGEKYQKLCRRILLIDCAEETQVLRVMARNQLSRGAAEAMLAAQAPRAARQAIATDILVNDGNQEALPNAVRQLHEKFQELARETHCFS